jgi:hypothetical protein
MRGSKYSHYYNQGSSSSSAAEGTARNETHMWTKDQADHAELNLTITPEESGNMAGEFGRQVSFAVRDKGSDIKRVRERVIFLHLTLISYRVL